MHNPNSQVAIEFVGSVVERDDDGVDEFLYDGLFRRVVSVEELVLLFADHSLNRRIVKMVSFFHDFKTNKRFFDFILPVLCFI